MPSNSKTDDQVYNYNDAGYNGFLRRTLNSNPAEARLRGIGSMRAYKPQEVNFDVTPVSGSIGDIAQFGRVHINGPGARIDIHDEEGNPITRVGEQED